MMTGDISMLLAFTAGLLSFLSPCVLPLIPSYLGILGGLGGRSLDHSRSGLAWVAAGFILGFSVVFISLGILISTTFFFMGGALIYINWIAGIVVIVLGLNIIFDFLSFLNYEKRPFLKKLPCAEKREQAAFWSILGAIPFAFIAGAAFGVGWTPCIGPVLTSILLMAGQSGKIGSAVCYLALYSAGLGIPFLLAALFFDSFMKHSSRLRPHLLLIRRISGVLLIFIGLMILNGRYSVFNVLIQRLIFGYINWAEARALPFRLLADWLAWLQKF